ncbi:hypothetical protein ACFL27_16805 [candidate division CSSED10-310 bacterium]|uniref:DUF1574 domain-containing protein n=1 Tax=candidate division CSSED10-310 bacterium TaxID=2855610 RepID=A0ABV6Z089_UNCC1
MKSKELRLLLWITMWLGVLLGSAEYIILKGWIWKIASLEPYMLRQVDDSWVRIAFELQRIKNRNRKSTDCFFIYLGGSAGRDSIISDNYMMNKLSDLSGKTVGFSSLCSRFKTFSTEASILDELGDFGGTVLITIEALRFTRRVEEQLSYYYENFPVFFFYLTPNDRVIELLTEHGYRPKFRDRIRLFRTVEVMGDIVKRQMKHFLHTGNMKRLTYQHGSRRNRPPVPQDKEPGIINRYESMHFQDYASYHQLNLELLREVIKRAHSNNCQIILIDIPQNPLFSAQIAVLSPHYDEMVHVLVKENNLLYIDMRHAAQWDAVDFRDAHHLRQPGYQKYSAILSEKLAELIRNFHVIR